MAVPEEQEQVELDSPGAETEPPTASTPPPSLDWMEECLQWGTKEILTILFLSIFLFKVFSIRSF